LLLAIVGVASAAHSSVHFAKDGAVIDYSINHDRFPIGPSAAVSVHRTGVALRHRAAPVVPYIVDYPIDYPIEYPIEYPVFAGRYAPYAPFDPYYPYLI
jgi:hypothetical protein